ncbi:hypothetical protein [Streptomyces sp. XY006]|uniref:hypothetical protein n=1 Tax=Streptomyces sp. XY006 TaxID=2021410 RepID=UPI000B8C52EB|nr:hypothetical protein [Streptomyces sp. XY006]OXS35436.1 hypothetical protein CHR28_10535 [Streptomyces sp. XY006]
MITSTKPQLSFELSADHLRSVLRVDQIRTDTLVQLVQHWGEPQSRDDVIAALDELAAVMQGPRREGELDAALEQVEDVAGMDSPQVEVSIQDTHRLHAELTRVDTVLSRFNPERRTA